MEKIYHLIYLPGLGDQKPRGQTWLVNRWQRPALRVHYHQLGWADGQAFEPKLERILRQIDQLHSGGARVSLLGISAGASAALNAYAARASKVSAVVYICGKLLNPQKINPRFFSQNPAFQGSMQLASANLAGLGRADTSRMLSLQPLFDELVPVADTKIPGVANKTISSVGHIPTIAIALLFYRRPIVKFLRSR